MACIFCADGKAGMLEAVNLLTQIERQAAVVRIHGRGSKQPPRADVGCRAPDVEGDERVIHPLDVPVLLPRRCGRTGVWVVAHQQAVAFVESKEDKSGCIHPHPPPSHKASPSAKATEDRWATFLERWQEKIMPKKLGCR